MNISDLGYKGWILKNIDYSESTGFEIARVIVEHKDRYIIQDSNGTANAEITGNLRYSANSRSDFPAVGDWVKTTKIDDENSIILEVLPRFSVLERKAVGKTGEIQIIASNIDFAFIVQSVGHDFNINRLERYLTICRSASIEPIIVITKIDLVEQSELYSLHENIKSRIENITIFAISNETKLGLNNLNTAMLPQKTYCFIGSSGVGKSTLVNQLVGNNVLRTKEISAITNKGKHTTSHRELIVLPNKSIIIDTPGMRELGLTEQESGIDLTYELISDLASKCKFSDCSHSGELNCAVEAAIEKQELSEESFENYQKLKREQEHFSSTVYEKRKKDKEFGKMIKAVKNQKNKRKY